MLSHYETGRVPRIRVGPDALDALPGELDSLVADTVLLVADPSLASSGLLQKLQSRLARHLALETTTLPPGEPGVDSVDELAALLRSLKQPAVLGIGGGSTLDAAKLAAAVAADNLPTGDYLLAARALPQRLPLILIPTTAGTGAEVTRTAVVKNPAGDKLWAWGDSLLADGVILDPVLCTTLPAPLTATTGLDALVHALEAVTGQKRNALLTAPALQAIALVVEWLPTAVSDPTDLQARQGMLEAACLAGQAIDQGGTGIAHNIGHALGSLYRLPHGAAVALGLLAALEWNLAQAPRTYDAPARAFEPTARGEDFPRLYRRLLDQVDFAGCLPAPPPEESEADNMARVMAATENQSMALNNVRPPEEADLLTLAQATLSCWRRLFRDEE